MERKTIMKIATKCLAVMAIGMMLMAAVDYVARYSLMAAIAVGVSGGLITIGGLIRYAVEALSGGTKK